MIYLVGSRHYTAVLQKSAFISYAQAYAADPHRLQAEKGVSEGNRASLFVMGLLTAFANVAPAIADISGPARDRFGDSSNTFAAVESGHGPFVRRLGQATPITDTNILFAADGWKDNNDPTDEYGHISNWDTSSVTGMEEVFSKATAFNGDLSRWDVSSVTTMERTFRQATAFNGDLPLWDVSSVTSMKFMFQYAPAFNGDISPWDVSSVTDMTLMFQYAPAFNGDISPWDVSSVKYMDMMFRGAAEFNGDLSPWDVSTINAFFQIFKDSGMVTVLGGKWIDNVAAKAESSVILGTHAPTASPTPGPTVSGDPHLVGLLGQKFDLVGKPNAKYLLIGDDRVQINVVTNNPFFEHSADAQLRAADNHAGLFLTEVEVAYADSDGVVYELSIKGDYDSTVRPDRRHASTTANTKYCDGGSIAEAKCLRGLEVRVEGEAIDAAPEMAIGRDGMLNMVNDDCAFSNRGGRCKNKATNGGYALVTLHTPSVNVEVGAAFMNNHKLGQKSLHHLDLGVSGYRPSGVPGGLIGQTVVFKYDREGNPIMSGPGCIEGSEDDYIVLGLDSTKLRNSTFNVDGSPFASTVDGAATGVFKGSK